MAATGSSRFAVTCGLLRQYMREHQQQLPQQQMGGLASAFRLPPLPVATEEAEETDARTMQLFPTRAGASSQPSQERPEAPAKAPLTIVYEGRVLVFDYFPADKAKELMRLAGTGSFLTAPQKRAPAVREEPDGEASALVPSDLPIARKSSVRRFLKKRKHRWIYRISATDPYIHKSPAPEKDAAGGETAAKDEPAASWLAL